MKLYRFSPIKTKDKLFKAIEYLHYESEKLLLQYFDQKLDNAGNLGVFCHYLDEYEALTEIRKELTHTSDNSDQKYFELKKYIKIDDTIYTHLYVRRPDPYRHYVGDVDFYLSQVEYDDMKEKLQKGKIEKYGMRLFPRPDLDMIELFDPDSDVIVYVSTSMMSEDVRVKQSEFTNL